MTLETASVSDRSRPVSPIVVRIPVLDHRDRCLVQGASGVARDDKLRAAGKHVLLMGEEPIEQRLDRRKQRRGSAPPIELAHVGFGRYR